MQAHLSTLPPQLHHHLHFYDFHILVGLPLAIMFEERVLQVVWASFLLIMFSPVFLILNVYIPELTSCFYLKQWLSCPSQCCSQLAGCHPGNWKVTGSFPSQGTRLGCRFDPWSGHVQKATNQCFSLALMFLFLSFSLPSFLSKIKNKNFFKSKKFMTVTTISSVGWLAVSVGVCCHLVIFCLDAPKLYNKELNYCLISNTLPANN